MKSDLVVTEPAAAQNSGGRQSLDLPLTQNGSLIPQPGPEPQRLSEYRIGEEQRRLKILRAFDALVAQGLSKAAAMRALGLSVATLWRYQRMAKAGSLAPRTDKCGRKPATLPTAGELACVREIYVKLDQSEVRGRGLGSSRVAAYRIAARSDDARITDDFRRVILARKGRTLPPSWDRLLHAPASVLAHARDARSTTSAYINTPRNRTYIDAAGNEQPLRPGVIFEADDGTLNFYAWIPWPFGGDRCSERFGVKLGRWQMLAVVDAHSLFCPAFDIVARNFSSYRGEDSAALLGRTMLEIGVPELWRLERGSWESEIVRTGLDLSQVRYTNAWHSKQKSAVEGFFNRLWTPASLIPGHVGRNRDRFRETTNLALACQDGRLDPREHFLSLEAATPRVSKAVEFVNGELVESKAWGRWIPKERWQDGGATLRKLDPSLRLFFSREQKVWKVRGCCVGGRVPGPLINFPVYFQCPELWEFEQCHVKCYFDPYVDARGTLVLNEQWRNYKPGHVIARDVEALDLPPQAVLAEDWEDADAKTLMMRKAIAKAVRTETWNWLGGQTSQARDGLGNLALRRSAEVPAPARRSSPAPTRMNLLGSFLADVRNSMVNRNVDRLFTRDLVAALNPDHTRPWEPLRRSREISEHWLAGTMKELGLRPRNVRAGDRVAKGYLLADVERASARYVQTDCNPAAVCQFVPEPPSESHSKTR